MKIEIHYTKENGFTLNKDRISNATSVELWNTALYRYFTVQAMEKIRLLSPNDENAHLAQGTQY